MIKKLIPTLLAISFLLLSWQLVAIGIGYPDIFPTLPDLFKNTGLLLVSADFYPALLYTVLRGLAGFFLSFIFAFTFALMSAFSSFWKAFFHPVLVVIRSIPVISLVLIALLWFSPPNLPVFIALLTMLPVLYQNILNGLEHTDKRFIEMARVFGKTRRQIFHYVYLPSAKSLIFSGISTAMGFGWRAIIIGEVLAQPVHGIGTGMKQAQAYINVSELIAWTVIAIGVSYFFEFIIKISGKIKIHYRFTHNYRISSSADIKEINVHNLSKKFNQNIVFSSFSTTFNSSSINCLKSPSGKGKTTLLRLISGIEVADSGEIKKQKNHSVAYSFQDVRLLPWLTVEENICFAMPKLHNQVAGKNSMLIYLLEKTELTDHRHKYPYELSGGQQQRVGLARALAAQTDILLLDEPLTGLDDVLKAKIIAFTCEWIATRKPLTIWATHENIVSSGTEVKEFTL
ncbi:MAG: ATP-binding cassette domain-containing protein [Bacteroidales bacterium]|nr:ATP-binding cassette domain-containing protein [Bacteroidales bacterium]